MQREWLEMVALEGTADIVLAQAGDGDGDPEAEPPCPACGTAAPLVDGECSECGLYLAG